MGGTGAPESSRVPWEDPSQDRQSEAERIARAYVRDTESDADPFIHPDTVELARAYIALQAQVEHLEKRQAVYHDWAWEVLDNLSAEDAKKWSGNLGRALEPHEDPNV